MSDSQCQLAQECFDNLDVNNKKIRNLANLYIKKLNKKFTNNIPKSAYNIPQNTFWHFPLHVLNNYDLFQDYLFKINADCVSYGLPLLTEIDIFSRYASNLDNSNLVKKNTIFLPIHSDYLEKDINYLINKINDYKYEI